MSETIIITGKANVEAARVLAVRSGLSIEIKTGMQLSRGRSASQIATETILRPAGLVKEGKRPNKTTVYRLLNQYIIDNIGEDFDRPLPA